MKVRSKRLIYAAIGFFIVAVLYALKNTTYFARASAFVASFFVFWLVDNLFDIKFRMRHYWIIVFIATTGILFSPLYWIYPSYDKLLHFFSPILFCVLIFYLVNKIEGISFSMKMFLTISITVSFLALWEMVEFGFDWFYDLKLQGVWVRDVTGMEKISLVMDKNQDTMMDMILGTLGTVLFAIGKSVGHYIERFKKLKNKKKK